MSDYRLGIVQQICAPSGALAADFAAGNEAAISVDLGKAQSYVDGIMDAGDHQTAQGYVDPWQAKFEALTPDQAAANQAQFAQEAAHISQDAQALNSDPVYNQTEGNLTSTQAANSANADFGASNNFLNDQSFDAGLGTWVDQGGLGATFNAATTGDQHTPPSLPGFFKSPGAIVALAIGAAVVVTAVFVGFARFGR